MKAWIGASLLVVGHAHADAPPSDPCACSPNKPGFHRASALTGDWGGWRSRLFEDGVKLQATYTGEVFAAPALAKDRTAVAGLASLALDVELGTLVGGGLGTLHASAFGIHGSGLSERLRDVYGVSNNVAPEDLRLFEAWIDQPIGPLSLRAGLLSADQQFTLAAHSVVLLNATFGVVGIVSYDVIGPVYPVATPAVAATVEVGSVTVRAAIYDGDRIEDHGIPRALADHTIAFAEVELFGAVKLGGWKHTNLGGGGYAIVDRQLGRYLGAFARLALAPSCPIDVYVDTGIRIGPGPFRPKDFASVGMAFASSDVGVQTIVEASYQALVTGWLTIQPDAQLLLDRSGTTAIVATRAVIAF
ncbi:MAG: carbohydrate porin [Kofleriaceae bacterium]